MKETLQSPHCIGFVGGRVNHAIYFVGHRTTASGGTELLGLDPHRYITSDRKDANTSSVTIIEIVI